MSIIKKDEIAAFRRGDGSVVCVECADDEDWKDISEDDIITENEITRDDEYMYFCDACKKAIVF